MPKEETKLVAELEVPEGQERRPSITFGCTCGVREYARVPSERVSVRITCQQELDVDGGTLECEEIWVLERKGNMVQLFYVLNPNDPSFLPATQLEFTSEDHPARAFPIE